jgi:hypothetical protein
MAGNAWFCPFLRQQSPTCGRRGTRGAPSTPPTPCTSRATEASMDTGTEAWEADMAAIGWALLGLVTGWVSELVHDGSRGRASGRSGLLGSVSSELALTAPQPLMLV